MSLVLRPYQVDAINKMRDLMRNGCRSILYQGSTGSGKTLLTAHMLKSCVERKQRAFFVVHRRELIKQSIRAFSEVGLPYGVISAGWWEEKNQPVQIASIQSLIRRHPKYAKPNLIVWDEAHHVGAKSWSDLHAQYPQAYHVGLTATPCRLDGKGLGAWFSKMVSGPSVNWFIKEGFLSNYRLYAPPGISTLGIHTRMGDFAAGELAAIVDRPTITGDAIAHYKRLAHGKRAVIFAVSIEHSKHIVSQFQAAGIQAEHVDGETKTEVRDEAIKNFEKGNTKILSNVELFGEGFDLPAIECGILLRPTQSIGLYLQQIGRTLRPTYGKSEAIILDHAGNALRHGLPDDERTWTLEGGANTSKRNDSSEPSVKICGKCFAAQLSGSAICQYCGYAFEIQSREVQQQEGELEEIDRAVVRLQRNREQGSVKDLEGLIQLGRQRKYKNPAAWARFVWEAREAKKCRAMK